MSQKEAPTQSNIQYVIVDSNKQRSSIKKKLWKGFGLLGLAIGISLAVTVWYVGSVVSAGYKVLGTYQPIKMQSFATMSGIHHLMAVLRQEAYEKSPDFNEQVNKIWKKEIHSHLDTLEMTAKKWLNDEGANEEKKAVYTALVSKLAQMNLLIGQLQALNSTIALSEASSDPSDSTGGMAGGHKVEYNAQLASFVQTQVAPLYKDIDSLFSQFVELNQKDIDTTETTVNSKVAGLNILECFSLLFLVGTLILIVRRITKQIKVNIEAINEHIVRLAGGAIPGKLSYSDSELDTITDSVNQLTSSLSSIKEFALHVGSGDFNSEIKVFDDQGELGVSLAQMRDGLKQVSDQDKIRYWTNEGLAKFGNILRDNASDLKKLSDQVISHMVKYLNANQGSLFVLNNSEGHEPFLELTSCYAFDKKKYVEKQINRGQGLVGQTWQEGESVYLRKIPESYIQITSGLGGAKPGYLLIVPLKLNGEVHGVIELASFFDFEKHKIEFVEKIAENIASTISGTRVAEQTRQLLNESQMMAEQMRAQEEEMRQNMEEMEATQEEMHRSQRAIIQKETNLTALVNNTDDMITILDTDYRVVVANNAITSFYATRNQHLSVGVNILDLLTGQEKEKWHLAYGRALAGETFVSQESVDTPGGKLYFELQHFPIKDDNGTIRGASIISRNVTRYKVAEFELRAQLEAVANK